MHPPPTETDCRHQAEQPTGLEVLVIDDSPAQLRLTSRVLAKAGFQVRTAPDGIQGLALASAAPPDVIVSDVLMPELNGYQVCRLLKDDPVTAGVPVVLLTALEDRIDRFWAEESGADGFVSKSDLLRELVPSVRSACNARRGTPARTESDPDSPGEFDPRARSTRLLERMLLEQTITQRFRRIGVDVSEPTEVARRILHSIDLLFDVQAAVLTLPLAAGAVAHVSTADADDPLLDALTWGRQDQAAVRRVALGTAEPRSGAGVAWSTALVHGERECGWIALLLAREPAAHERRILELVRDELGGVAARVLARERQDALHAQVLAANRESEQFLAALSSVLIGVDSAGQIVRWNEAAARAFGLDAEQVLGRAWQDVRIDWVDPECPRRLAEAGVIGETRRFHDLGFRGSDGSTRLFAATVDGAGRGSFVLIGREITEQRRVETELHEAQRLKGIGQLAAGLAHEMNTPGQYVNDNLCFLSESFAGLSELLAVNQCLAAPGAAQDPAAFASLMDEFRAAVERADLPFLTNEIPGTLKQTRDGVARMLEIVRAMKDFAGDGGAQRARIDVNEAVRNTSVISRKQWEAVAEMELALAEDLPPVLIAPGELRQALLNIVLNAVDAIRAAGRDGRGRIRIATALAGGALRITVEDDGAGFGPGVRERVFEPFFTTKPPGSGTGQGLSFAHAAVVQRGGGRLHCEPAEGGGARFVIELPAAVAAAAA